MIPTAGQSLRANPASMLTSYHSRHSQSAGTGGFGGSVTLIAKARIARTADEMVAGRSKTSSSDAPTAGTAGIPTAAIRATASKRFINNTIHSS
jgi:hypothetical protein